jgi:hypothetical protein
MRRRWYRLRVDDELIDVEATSLDEAFREAQELHPGAVTVSDMAGSRITLGIGELVRVFPLSIMEREPYNAMVVGYDMHRTKYHLGHHVYGDLYTDGIAWAFANEVLPVTEHKEY